MRLTGSLLPLLLLLGLVTSKRFYGCIYEPRLCRPEETCADDGLFGRCLEEESEKWWAGSIWSSRLAILKLELERLVRAGESWHSPKTQCLLSYFFMATHHQLPYDDAFCAVREPENILALVQMLEGKLKWMEAEAEESVGAGDEEETGRNAMLEKIVGDLVGPLASSRDQRESERPNMVYKPGGSEADYPEQSGLGLSEQEEELLTSLLAEIMRGRKPALDSLSDGQLDKFIAYVELMQKMLREGDGMTEGEVLVSERRGDPDAEKLLLKKDEEEIGDMDLGLSQKTHKIVKGGADLDTNPILSQQIRGNRVYIKLNKEIEMTPDSLARLVSYLDEKIGRPKNLTFSDFQVAGKEVSFRVSPETDGLDWLRPVTEAKAVARRIPALDVAEAVYAQKKDVQSALPEEAAVAKVKVGGPEGTVEVAGRDGDVVALTSAVAGAVVAVLVVLLGVAVYRRRSRTRLSLKGLAEDVETQPSKAYEELCRQRMAAKGERPEPLGGILGQRLSSQSESSPPAGAHRSPRSSTSSWSEEPVASTNMDISTGHVLLSYLEHHLSNKDLLEEEWNSVGSSSAAAVTVAEHPDNAEKNRRGSVLPYDGVRVMLQSGSAAGDTDYINASPIHDHDPQCPLYIAAQAPLPHTLHQFWQMIWEQGCVVIVNLTKLQEDSETQCHRYWPDNGSEVFGVFEVHLVSEHIWCEDYLVRSFYLKNLRTNETRTVTQFHFLGWPAVGVPSAPKPLLEFRRKVNKSYRGRASPILVHCSDGSDRTGTYCLLDIVLNRINKGVKEIDMAATVEHLRDQRMKMVGSLHQYEFVVSCVAEEVQAILKALAHQ